LTPSFETVGQLTYRGRLGVSQLTHYGGGACRPLDLTSGEPKEPAASTFTKSHGERQVKWAAGRRGPAGGPFFSFAIPKKSISRPFLETTDTFAKKRPIRGRWVYERGRVWELQPNWDPAAPNHSSWALAPGGASLSVVSLTGQLLPLPYSPPEPTGNAGCSKTSAGINYPFTRGLASMLYLRNLWHSLVHPFILRGTSLVPLHACRVTHLRTNGRLTIPI